MCFHELLKICQDIVPLPSPHTALSMCIIKCNCQDTDTDTYIETGKDTDTFTEIETAPYATHIEWQTKGNLCPRRVASAFLHLRLHLSCGMCCPLAPCGLLGLLAAPSLGSGYLDQVTLCGVIALQTDVARFAQIVAACRACDWGMPLSQPLPQYPLSLSLCRACPTPAPALLHACCGLLRATLCGIFYSHCSRN